MQVDLQINLNPGVIIALQMLIIYAGGLQINLNPWGDYRIANAYTLSRGICKST